MKKIHWFIAGILFSVSTSQVAYGALLSAEYQFDTRGFNTLNFSGKKGLPVGFLLTGFVDLESSKTSGPREDYATYFMEIDIRTPMWKGIGSIVELNSVSGSGNELGRIGLFYAPEWHFLEKISGSLFFKILPLETDREGWQSSIAWNLKIPAILEGRFSIGGFYDLNFKAGTDKKKIAVSDTQIRFRLIGDLSLLAEYRFNDLLPSKKKHGVGLGVKYKF